MKRFALALGTTTLTMLVMSVAAQSTDRLAGTWTLNVAKSQFSTGTPPKSQTTVLHAMDGGLHEVVDRVNADGTTTHFEVVAKYDGQPYPVKGDPARDTASFRRIDANTVEVVNRKSGAIVNTMRIAVAPDGKTRTNTVTITDAAGKATENVMIFERR